MVTSDVFCVLSLATAYDPINFEECPLTLSTGNGKTQLTIQTNYTRHYLALPLALALVVGFTSRLAFAASLPPSHTSVHNFKSLLTILFLLVSLLRTIPHYSSIALSFKYPVPVFPTGLRHCQCRWCSLAVDFLFIFVPIRYYYDFCLT